MKTAKQRAKQRKGFTLIEVIIVVAILAILAALAVPNIIGMLSKGTEAQIVQDASAIKDALNTLEVENKVNAITGFTSGTCNAAAQTAAVTANIDPALESLADWPAAAPLLDFADGIWSVDTAACKALANGTVPPPT